MRHDLVFINEQGEEDDSLLTQLLGADDHQVWQLGVAKAGYNPYRAADGKFASAPGQVTHGGTHFRDPKATVKWSGKGAATEKLPGAPLAPWTAAHAKDFNWAGIPDKPGIDPGEPPVGFYTTKRGEKVPKRMGAGVLIREPDGRVWVVEPKNHFGGYANTFPKGGLEKGLSLQQTAIKEAFEESGLQVEITGHVGDFERDTSVARYYTARRIGGDPNDFGWETASVKLVPPAALGKVFNRLIDRKIAQTLDPSIELGEDAPVKPKGPLPKVWQPGAKTPEKLSPMKGPSHQGTEGFDGQTDPSVIFGNNDFQSLGGSNGARLYVGKDGVARVVKKYKSAAHAEGEKLANRLYRDLELGAPKTETFTHNGAPHVTTLFAPNFKTAKAQGLSKDLADRVLDGFAADVLTANWDSVGLELDNVGTLKSGKVMRIDNGGAFLTRAQGQPKTTMIPHEKLYAIDEWHTLAPGGKNFDYAKVFQAAGVKSADALGQRAVKQIEAIRELETKSGGWEKYVHQHTTGLDAQVRAQMVKMLQARSTLLYAKAASLKVAKSLTSFLDRL